tara:strand:- start:1335 stop:3173 length:1839 start_codon:yes stop_codon:yes gene_type:complete
MAQKKISYTERDFLGLRNELLRLTNIYYPDLIQDASDASIYSLFLDLNAAVADNLHYSIDRSLQETVLQFAQERSSLYNIARTYGLKIPGKRPSVALCDLSVIVPARGDQEDTRYLGLLKSGSQFRGAGQVFELVNDCDFSSQYSVDGTPNRTKIPNLDANGIIVNYTITKREPVVNGVTRIFKKEIRDIDSKPFFKLFLPERNVLGVTNVIYKEGTNFQSLPSGLEFINSPNKYYEMQALAEQDVFIINPSMPADDAGLKVGNYIQTDNRFITEHTPEGYFFLTFGGGNNTPQELLDDFSRYGMPLDLNRFMNTASMGTAVRPNTTIFVQYRVGGGTTSNVGAGAINSVGVIDFVVYGPNTTQNNRVINSLAVNNVTAAVGGADQMTEEEVRNYVSFNFAGQNRAVTINDYVNKIRTMPAVFGAAAKVGVTEIENKVKIDILSYNPDGTLTSNVSNTLKSNIVTYLSNYRMLNDYIEIASGNVIDLAFEVDLIIEQGVNQSEIITNVITKVGDYFGVSKVEMGAPVNMGNLRRQIMEQPGVINIVDIKVFNKVGNGYSSSEISQAYVDPETKQIALIDETIFLQPNEIAAIRVPQVDINVRFKQPSQPIIY